MARKLYDKATHIFIDNKNVDKAKVPLFTDYLTKSNYYLCNPKTKIIQKDYFKIDPISYTDSNYILLNDLRINAFISAPCNRCECCYNKSRLHLVSRLTLEASDFPYLYFYTLTYSDSYLPSRGVKRSDVSGFLKRLRINVARHFSAKYNISLSDATDKFSFRTFYVGEYGKITKRPHYHGLFFFKRQLTYHEYLDFIEIFKKSWKYGYILDIQKCKNPLASAVYVSKYLTKWKSLKTPKGMNPCFYQGPVKNGGLGMSNYTKYDYILKSPHTSLELNIDGKVTRTSIPPHLIQKFYPYFCRKYPHASNAKYLFDTIYSLLQLRTNLDHDEVNSIYQEFRSKFLFNFIGSKKFNNNLDRTCKFFDIDRNTLNTMDAAFLYDKYLQLYEYLVTLPLKDDVIKQMSEKSKMYNKITPDTRRQVQQYQVSNYKKYVKSCERLLLNDDF